MKIKHFFFLVPNVSVLTASIAELYYWTTHIHTVRSALRMEETHFSKMLVPIYWSTQHHIPEKGNFQSLM
jgi:hypothetical protein